MRFRLYHLFVLMTLVGLSLWGYRLYLNAPIQYPAQAILQGPGTILTKYEVWVLARPDKKYSDKYSAIEWSHKPYRFVYAKDKTTHYKTYYLMTDLPGPKDIKVIPGVMYKTGAFLILEQDSTLFRNLPLTKVD